MSLGGAGGALGRAGMDSCQLQLKEGAVRKNSSTVFKNLQESTSDGSRAIPTTSCSIES